MGRGVMRLGITVLGPEVAKLKVLEKPIRFMTTAFKSHRALDVEEGTSEQRTK
jgi:hypothetical protein